MNLKPFIAAIAAESLGFSFAQPWRPSESSITCVLPIIRGGSNRQADYIVLSKARMVTITDSGNINKAIITNEESLPVFIRTGELFKGSTQERSATYSQLIMPGMKTEIDIVCVHASKGIQPGASFTSHGYAPGRDAFFMKANFTGTISQSESWNQDRSYTSLYSQTVNQSGRGMSLGSTPTPGHFSFTPNMGSFGDDDLTKVRDAAINTFKDVLKQVPLLDNQIGMALIDLKGLHSLDCFNLHAPWKHIKEAIVGKEVLSIAQTNPEEVFSYRPEYAKKTVSDVLKKGFNERVIYKAEGTKTIALDFKDFIGEAVLLGEDVVHLLVARK